MPIAPFKLERYYALYEFNARIMFSSSDCESLSMAELLAMASPASLSLWNNLKLGYTETQGNPALRAEAARQYDHVPPENLMVAAPEELIFIAMQTLLQPGDHVVALAPAYQSLYEIASSIGCDLTFWHLRPAESGWEADLDQLEKLISPRTRMLVLNFPNNPTGYLPSLAEFNAIIAIARKYGITIFTDEMYRLLEYQPGDRLPAICDAYEKGISLSGLSKSMALPGLRIGWLASQDSSLIDRWSAFKDYTTICNSAPSEILGLIALQNAPAIVKRNLEIIRHNISIATNVFTQYLHLFQWLPLKAGSIAFPEWKGRNGVDDLCQRMLDQFSVMIVPGSMFDYPGNHFRLGLGRKNFNEGMRCLEQYLSENKEL
jgi:aspartate/methionine/tyrosine aminotransferase